MKSRILPTQKTFLSTINWRLFGILLLLVAFGLISLIPYGLTLAGQKFSAAMIPELFMQFLVQIVLYSALILGGMFLGQKVGLGAPILSNLTQGKGFNLEKKTSWLAVLSGLGAGFLMILFDVYIFVPRLQSQIQALGDTVRPSAWQGFLASFYGGIVEEVMTRFFLLTLLAWIGSKIFRSGEIRQSPVLMWVVVLISGLIFGLAHLPTAAALGVQLTPLYIIRTLALNGAGILYGWLYLKRGLESAMLAHYSTDLVVHMLGAILLA